MWGAIIGDVVGSRYEWDPIKTKTFEFFHPLCKYTDDSVCTAAVADILLNDTSPVAVLQQWCQRHPGRGYGGWFSGWLHADNPSPYNSFGNGAAMRASPAAYLNRNRSLEEALGAADRVTAVTHDHPEGVKGARAAVHSVWLAFQGEGVDRIRRAIEQTYEYDLSRTVDEIRPDYRFNETCQGTVPQAIVSALESVNFEDAVRNAISLGGDADTLAAIAGPIAEALYGIPEDMLATARGRFLEDAPDIVDAMDRMYGASI